MGRSVLDPPLSRGMTAYRVFPPRLLAQLLHRRLDRRGGIIITLPRFRLREQRGYGPHREALRVEIALHLGPGQRHRDGSAVARTRRQHGDRRRHAVVAEIIEEDL